MHAMSTVPSKRVLAVASGGGHWIQLRRITSSLHEHELIYATTLASYRQEIGSSRFYVVADGNQRSKLPLLRTAAKLLWILVRERPDVVISTGAAPGYLAVRMAKWFGARTVWIDSIANVESLSLSGHKAQKYADLCLTQWPHLAQASGPVFRGAVL